LRWLAVRAPPGGQSAELLTSTALVAGPARAVAAAEEVLGTDAVGRAIPLLQPLARSSATRAALRHHRGLVGDLRARAAVRTGA
jgi:glycosyltransferase 2 family protein